MLSDACDSYLPIGAWLKTSFCKVRRQCWNKGETIKNAKYADLCRAWLEGAGIKCPCEKDKGKSNHAELELLFGAIKLVPTQCVNSVKHA
eukprot:4725710-Amphidinium_carterae.1